MIITDKTLSKLLKERGGLVKRGRYLTKRIERLEKALKDFDDERNELGMKIAQLQDRMIPIVREKVESGLGEFEELANMELRRGGVIDIEVVDKVEEFKRLYLERIKTRDEKAATLEEAENAEE